MSLAASLGKAFVREVLGRPARIENIPEAHVDGIGTAGKSGIESRGTSRGSKQLGQSGRCATTVLTLLHMPIPHCS